MSKVIALPQDLYTSVAELAGRDRVSVEDFEPALNQIPDLEPDGRDRIA